MWNLSFISEDDFTKQITTILGTFIREYSTISKSVTFPIMVMRAAGMLSLKIRTV